MESTCVTKVFDPPNRETGRSLPAEQVALAAAAANNAVKAALSPRIRPKLGLHLEEAPRMTVEGADRPTRRPKGVMEDPPECIRKANGPYPSSPVIVAAKVPPVSHGSRTPALSSQRTASREAKHSNAQPLSARPKARNEEKHTYIENKRKGYKSFQGVTGKYFAGLRMLKAFHMHCCKECRCFRGSLVGVGWIFNVIPEIDLVGQLACI